MSPLERKVDLILMAKRWELIQSGVSKQDIKIKGNRIYVKLQKIGSVSNLKFIPDSQVNSLPSTPVPSSDSWLATHFTFFNARSICNKFPNLQVLVYSSIPGIYAITESWLSNNIFHHEILPQDYFIYRNDRNSRGGGVLLAIHNSLPSRLINSPPDLEVICVSLIHINLTVCVVYVPPSVPTQVFHDTLRYLTKIVSLGPTVILGDFNLPDIDWLSLSCSSPLSLTFCDFVFDNNLSQLVLEPTHCKGNCLDLILSNSPHHISPITMHFQKRSYSLWSLFVILCFHILQTPSGYDHFQACPRFV